jgi:hypothetical protein
MADDSAPGPVLDHGIHDVAARVELGEPGDERSPDVGVGAGAERKPQRRCVGADEFDDRRRDLVGSLAAEVTVADWPPYVTGRGVLVSGMTRAV